MKTVILAVGFANGEPCPHSNQWLASFDHEAFGGQGHGVFTKDPDFAMRFPDAAAAMAFWGRQSITKPRRPDGRPNKPLTALTVVIETMD
jgi:hypothetical protein